MDVILTQGYSPSEAENGKFLPVDMTGTAYQGVGKYAVMVYPVNGSSNPLYTSLALPDKIVVYSTTINQQTSTFNPAVSVTHLEIYNRVASGSSTAYFMLSTTTAQAVTAQGIPIVSNGYYTIYNVRVTSFTIGTDGNSDLRIIGHYV